MSRPVVWLYGRPVHNHGVEEGLGLSCPEHTAEDGRPIGACILGQVEPCAVCNGSGLVAAGPWGSRPPRVRCADCAGSGFALAPAAAR